MRIWTAVLSIILVISCVPKNDISVKSSRAPEKMVMSNTPSVINFYHSSLLEIQINSIDKAYSGYKYKMGAVSIDCQELTGYSSQTFSTSSPITENVSSFSANTTNPNLKLCVIGSDPELGVQDTAKALSAIWVVDQELPVATIVGAPISDVNTNSLSASVDLMTPGDIVSYRYKLLSGTSDFSACTSLDNYSSYRSVSTPITSDLSGFGASEMFVLCVLAKDGAGNEQSLQQASYAMWSRVDSSMNSSTTIDTTTLAPDTTTMAPDTTTIAPETTTMAPDTTTIAPETTTMAPDTTTIVVNDSPAANFIKVAVAPNNSSTIVAEDLSGMFYQSSNAGQTWIQLCQNPSPYVGLTGQEWVREWEMISISRGSDQTPYLTTWGAMYRLQISDNGLCPEITPPGTQVLSVNGFANMDSDSNGTVYITGHGAGLHKSYDHGNSWIKTSWQGSGYSYNVTIDQSYPQRVILSYLFADNNILLSEDGGNTFKNVTPSGFPSSFSYPRIFLDPQRSGVIYSDNGYLSHNFGYTWYADARFNNDRLKALHVDTVGRAYRLISYGNQTLIQRNFDLANSSWQTLPGGTFNFALSSAAELDKAQISAQGNTIAVLIEHKLLISRDGGEHFIQANMDLSFGSADHAKDATAPVALITAWSSSINYNSNESINAVVYSPDASFSFYKYNYTSIYNVTGCFYDQNNPNNSQNPSSQLTINDTAQSIAVLTGFSSDPLVLCVYAGDSSQNNWQQVGAMAKFMIDYTGTAYYQSPTTYDQTTFDLTTMDTTTNDTTTETSTDTGTMFYVYIGSIGNTYLNYNYDDIIGAAVYDNYQEYLYKYISMYDSNGCTYNPSIGTYNYRGAAYDNNINDSAQYIANQVGYTTDPLAICIYTKDSSGNWVTNNNNGNLISFSINYQGSPYDNTTIYYPPTNFVYVTSWNSNLNYNGNSSLNAQVYTSGQNYFYKYIASDDSYGCNYEYGRGYYGSHYSWENTIDDNAQTITDRLGGNVGSSLLLCVYTQDIYGTWTWSGQSYPFTIDYSGSMYDTTTNFTDSTTSTDTTTYQDATTMFYAYINSMNSNLNYQNNDSINAGVTNNYLAYTYNFISIYDPNGCVYNSNSLYHYPWEPYIVEHAQDIMNQIGYTSDPLTLCVYTQDSYGNWLWNGQLNQISIDFTGSQYDTTTY